MLGMGGGKFANDAVELTTQPCFIRSPMNSGPIPTKNQVFDTAQCTCKRASEYSNRKYSKKLE